MCIFCKIANGEIPSNKVYETDKVVAFYDLEPQAPSHILIIPKQHIACAADIDSSNSAVMADVFEAASEIAKKLSIDSFRLVNNCGEKAGQSVMHLHFHMLSGRDFAWPPG